MSLISSQNLVQSAAVSAGHGFAPRSGSGIGTAGAEWLVPSPPLPAQCGHEDLHLWCRLDRRNHRRASGAGEGRRGEPDRPRKASGGDPPERPASPVAARGFHGPRAGDRRSGAARSAGLRHRHPQDASVSGGARRHRAAARAAHGTRSADDRCALLVLPQASRPVRGQPAEALRSRRPAMVAVRPRARVGLRLLGRRQGAGSGRRAARERDLLPAARRARRVGLAQGDGTQPGDGRGRPQGAGEARHPRRAVDQDDQQPDLESDRGAHAREQRRDRPLAAARSRSRAA